MKEKKPIIITNFKTYEIAVGEKAVELAIEHDKVAKKSNADFAVVVGACELNRVANAVSIDVFVEHCDPQGFGSNTGKIIVESVKAAGASGILLNHSENRLRLDIIEDTIKRAKNVGLKICLCANTVKAGLALSQFNPDFVAIEPPELIGGDVSVTNANPKIISDSVEKIKNVQVLVGAGIKDGNDVKTAYDLGAGGVLLASGVTKAKNPKEVLEDLASKI